MMQLSPRFKTLFRPNESIEKSCTLFLQNQAVYHTIFDLGEIDLTDFHLINSHMDATNAYAFTFTKEHRYSFDLCFVSYTYQFHTASRSGGHTHLSNDLYIFGRLKLKSDFGIALMRPEMWEDKLSEFFERKEIEFEHRPLLNRRFYILANDEAHFRYILPEAFLAYIEQVKGLSIEFRHHECLYRLPKPFEANEASQLCQIGFDLDRIFNYKEIIG